MCVSNTHTAGSAGCTMGFCVAAERTEPANSPAVTHFQGAHAGSLRPQEPRETKRKHRERAGGRKRVLRSPGSKVLSSALPCILRRV